MNKEIKELDDSMEFKPAIFDTNKDDLRKVVEETKKLTLNIEACKENELTEVYNTRIKLSKTRTAIKKVGKRAREKAIKYQKDIIAYEKELIEIIEPEEVRLKKIEKDVEEHKIRKERLESLPDRKAKLENIGRDKYLRLDEDLLKMSNIEFQSYFNGCKADYNQLREKQLRIDREELEREKAKLEQEKKDEVLRKDKESKIIKEEEEEEEEKKSEEQYKKFSEAEEKKRDENRVKLKEFYKNYGFFEDDKNDGLMVHSEQNYDEGTTKYIMYKKIGELEL